MNAETDKSIGELARDAGVTKRTVRFYVSEGLIPPPSGQGQHQGYNREHLLRIKLILKLKKGYLPLRAIRERIAHLSLPEVEAMLADGASAVHESGAPYGDTVRSEERVPYGNWSEPRRSQQQDFFGQSETWSRTTLGPGIELSYLESKDPDRRAAIEKIVSAAAGILLEKTDDSNEGETGWVPS